MDLEALLGVQRRLQSIHDRLGGQLSESETESVQALSAYDNHPADLGALIAKFNREPKLTLRGHVMTHCGHQNRTGSFFPQQQRTEAKPLGKDRTGRKKSE